MATETCPWDLPVVCQPFRASRSHLEVAFKREDVCAWIRCLHVPLLLSWVLGLPSAPHSIPHLSLFLTNGEKNTFTPGDRAFLRQHYWKVTITCHQQ